MALGTAGFASASDTYERGRPSYPDALLEMLGAQWGLSGSALVADVAAGTGKLARQLRATGAGCLAMEPSAAMRAECRRTSPGVAMVAGSAEALPLGGGVVDLVTVAQAFHWFDPARSLHEMARVLRPGGALALIWNERDTTLPWTADLDALLGRVAPPPHGPTASLRPTFDGDPHFGPFTAWSARHDVPMRADQVADMVASRSYVRVLAPARRAAVLAQVGALTAPLPEPIVMPYIATAYCARVAAGPCGCHRTGPGPD